MRTTTKIAALGALGLAAAAFSMPAAAVVTTWNFVSGAGCTTNNSNFGNTRSCPVAGQPTANATAWSGTGVPSTSSGTELNIGRVVVYGGGLGITNQDGPNGPGSGDSNERDSDAPEHAIDNDQRKDAMLISFTSAVKLTDIQIGYRSGDSDMTVLAFTGGACASPLGQTYTSLLGCGWSLVSHVMDVPVQSGTNYTSIHNTSSISSQLWLIATYVSDPGLANAGRTFGTLDTTTTKDHVKLLAVVGDPNGRVPEPGTLGLLGLAALGFWGLRRKA